MDWQDIRVFISSTFNDMHAERDYLVKNVFPELAPWCEARKLHLVDIDLRWGVTSADSQAKNTVKKCLSGIDTCRLFFLCFLGQRRGWVPNHPLRLAYEKENGRYGLGEDELGDTGSIYRDNNHSLGRASVTELEIEHALLAPMYHLLKCEQPEPVKHAMFFHRLSPFDSTLDQAHRNLFLNDAVMEYGGDPKDEDAALEKFIAEEISPKADIIDYDCRFNPCAITPELRTERNGDVLQKGRLVDFSVQQSDVPQCYLHRLEIHFPAYAHNQTIPLKYVILAGLIHEILCQYPEREHVMQKKDDRYAVDLEQQSLFMGSLLKGYIPISDAAIKLDDYANGICPLQRAPLLLTAPAGIGKTTTLAHWISDTAKKRPVISRFCGVSDLASDQLSLWDSIFHEQGIQTPDTLNELQEKMDQLLEKLSMQGHNMIVIDAIDQLPNGLDMLSWLPHTLPPQLRLIISAKLPDERSKPYSDYLNTFNMLTLQPITQVSDKKKLISKYLEESLKALDDTHMDAICGICPNIHKQQESSENPLYLKILLSELRVFGAFKQLSDQINLYGHTPFDAFMQLLNRLEGEQPYDTLAAGDAVPWLFCLLVQARSGLTEDELAFCLEDQLGADPRIQGTIRYFLRQVRPFITTQSGQVAFLYDVFREAAEQKYSALKDACNRSLVKCFTHACDPDRNGSFAGRNTRALIALGYHTSACDHDMAQALYSQLPYLHARCSVSPIQPLLAELMPFDATLCRAFYQTILRFRAFLSHYPNALFSICRAQTSAPFYEQTERLISEHVLREPWLDLKPCFALQTMDATKANERSALTLALDTRSEPFLFNGVCAFSPNAKLFAFVETLSQLRIMHLQTFELSPCIVFANEMQKGKRPVSMQFSADCKQLAVLYEDAQIAIYMLSFDEKGKLVHAAADLNVLCTYKPKRGISSYCICDTCLYYQSDETTIKGLALSTASSTDLIRTERSFVLDCVISLETGIVLSLRQGMCSNIYCYSHTDQTAVLLNAVEGAFAKYGYNLHSGCFAIAFSDGRLMVMDVQGTVLAEKKIDTVISAICIVDQALMVLCPDNRSLLWHWAENRTQPISVSLKDGDVPLIGHAIWDGESHCLLGVFDGAIGRLKQADAQQQWTKADEEIIAMDELPALTIATASKSGIVIRREDFISPILPTKNDAPYHVFFAPKGVSLINKLGQAYFLAQNAQSYQAITSDLRPRRIVASCMAADGSIYHVNASWHFGCLQSDFTHDLSSYHFSNIRLQSFGQYIFIFGSGKPSRDTRDASDEYESLGSKTVLLIYQLCETAHPRFCGERLFPAKHGTLIDIAFHAKKERVYLLFNPPYSEKREEPLLVCHGTIDALLCAEEILTTLVEIPRMENAEPSTACIAHSYLICYRGNVFAFDVGLMTYQAAISIQGPISRIQPSKSNEQHALAVHDHATTISTITPMKRKE